MPELDGRIVFNSAPLQEGNSVHLVLRFRHYRYRSPSVPLALNCSFRMYTDGGFALSQNHILDYFEINHL